MTLAGLNFSLSGYFSPFNGMCVYGLDQEPGALYIHSDGQGCDLLLYRLALPEKEAERISKTVEYCGVRNWEKTYYQMACDGEQWHLSLNYDKPEAHIGCR